MELINRIRKSRKGFTLVEIIVVLVILAILAAFTIPAMLGFVGDAKGKAYIAEAREVYVAAQATATETNATFAIFDDKLGTALGSKAVADITDAPTLPTLTGTEATDKAAMATYYAGRASYQMKKYLDTAIGGDIKISTTVVPVTTPLISTFAAGESAWTIIVGTNDAAGTTGQVKSVIYYKDGYQVTITGGNSSVVKLKKT